METTRDAADEPFDLASLTLGEMAAVELASGQDFQRLLRAGSASRMLVVAYVRALRSPSSGSTPDWSEVSSHRPLDKRS